MKLLTFPFFGVVPAILNESGEELEGPSDGYLVSRPFKINVYTVFKQPWPGVMRTVYGNHQRFESIYFNKFPGYYVTGDASLYHHGNLCWQPNLVGRRFSAQTFRLDRLLKAERRFRDRSDPFMRDTGSHQRVFVGPYEGNATKRSRAQCVCVSLRCVATGTYLHTVGDAEHISKKVPCDTQGCSCPKYTAKYVRGVSQLFANTNCQVASYQLVGKRNHLYG
ncbi:Acetyl-coenzyme A synthetase [Merluccius polli]|uniref:Acetyl-coenzyme A synthetase n=1 Tax=Merluccius polli TaxID=89951 RepID=A0AA47N7R5_MERPO|nr:Acetyl-coenzyme A synthetase [Merluccius polli]